VFLSRVEGNIRLKKKVKSILSLSLLVYCCYVKNVDRFRVTFADLQYGKLSKV